MSGDHRIDLVGFAERLLALLDEGKKTATYKYAVLLGLMDLSLERVNSEGRAPQSVSTHDLARKVVQLYWPHTVAFVPEISQAPLIQNSGQQAKIIRLICDFRHHEGVDSSASLTRARESHPNEFVRLIREVEWVLALMPLPKLQRIGVASEPFIYRIQWDDDVRHREFFDASHDRTIHFVDDAADHLVRLAGLLRPLIQREWTRMVASLNSDLVTDSGLETFLFGPGRISLTPVREPLREIQGNRCFYCNGVLRREAHVDHFIPWSRHPGNDLENLVLTDAQCNNAKRDYLAAPEHLAHWREQMSVAPMAQLALDLGWEHDENAALGVARGMYLRLPFGTELWSKRDKDGSHFVPAVHAELRQVLA